MSKYTSANDLLLSSLGQIVLVKLKGGRMLRGTLRSFDIHLNLILTDAEEVGKSESKKLGTIIVRGDNVVLISPG